METNPKPTTAEAWKMRGYALYLFLHYTIRRFVRDRCLEAAGSLTFTTLLTLVPAVFTGFVVLSAFPVFGGFESAVENILLHTVPPETARIVVDALLQFAKDTPRASTMGIIGAGVTTGLLFLNIEAAFNAIWRVTDRRPAIWRLVSFWAVLTMGPMLLGIAVSASGPLLGGDAAGVAEAAPPLGAFDPLVNPLLAFAAMTLAYVIIPNRPVRLRHAVVGALVAVIVFELLQFVVDGILIPLQPLRRAYGGLAVIPVFLLVLFAWWTVVLVGAALASSLAEWGARSDVLGRPHLSAGNRMVVALALLAELQKASSLGVVRSRKDLLRTLKLGAFVVERVLDDLITAKYVARVGRDQWVLTRDLDRATVYDLYSDLKLGVSADPFRWLTATPWQATARDMITAFDDFGQDCMDLSLKELFTTTDKPVDRPATPDASG